VHRGYIKLWRKSLDSGLLKNSNLWAFWCWCLLKASHKEMKIMVGYQEINLLPGEFIFGRKKAARELKMSERTVRTCLKTLENIENVTTKATNKFTMVSVINWGSYQSDNNTTAQQIDQQVTNNRPTSDQQVTTNKNDKNVKNDKNSYIYKCDFFSIDNKIHEKYKKAYPKLDILTQYQKMAIWLESNPRNRKTPRGYPKFINSWLSRSAERANKETEPQQGFKEWTPGPRLD